MGKATGAPEQRLAFLVKLLNEYRMFVDLELIFDSSENFLYRQKGQLKLDNSVIEEFMPWIICEEILPELENADVVIGPAKAFSAVYFTSTLSAPVVGSGLDIRTKAQDFAVAKKLYLQASHVPSFPAGQTVKVETLLAYVATEIKTNLDKTMFQEACATANDVRSAIPGARYFLLCEYLDMTPLSTAPTDVDEVIILRKAKRLASNVRKRYGNSAAARVDGRTSYKDFLSKNSLKVEMFQRYVDHVRSLMSDEAPDERDTLGQGYF